jgi:CO/xanthine dehydrogenase Mo-binding subunit
VNAANTPGLAVADALAKAQGRLAYVTDLQIPGALHGVALRSPHGHARLLALDTTAARQMPGVRAVVSGLEYQPPEVPSEVFYDRPLSARPLLDPEVCHVGAPIALIAADSREQALAALAMLRPEWQRLPTVTSLADALADDAPPVRLGQSNEALPWGPIRWQQGAPDEVWTQAAGVREDWFTTSTVQAGALEPYACVVEPRDDGGVVLHKGVPAPFETRRQLALWLGVAESSVEVRCAPVGGGFGSRMDDLEYLAAVLVRETGRPVRMQLTRGEGWLAGRVRHGARMRVKSAVDSHGRLLARELEVWYDTGAWLDLGPFVVLRALRPLALYPCPHQRFLGHVVRTAKPVAGATRGFGNPQATFAVEVHQDRLCRQFGLDPLDFRRQHAIPAHGVNISVGMVDTRTGTYTPGGKPIATCALPQCFDLVTAAAERALAQLPAPASQVRRGVGLAAAMHTSGKGRVEVSTARVQWTEQGVCVESGAPDQGGTGVATTLQLVAARALALPAAEVTVHLRSTAAELQDSGAHASGRTFIAGAAVWQACEELKSRRAAGEVLPLKATVRHVPSTNAPPFAACRAIVDVDLDTGAPTVRWLGLALDVGHVLNPLQARGQVLGAAVQGLGFALSERLDFALDGRLLNTGHADYGTPRAFEVPPIEVLFADSTEPRHPLGCKGLGEIGLMAVAPAVVNAAVEATGRPLSSLPLTAESIWLALQESP